jgi:tRNA-2-methylthio-N6-dimethylallyladenosine synthase
MAVRDATGKFMALLKEQMPEVDEFMPIEEVGFDFEPLRADNVSAWVPISNGCNNFCTYCVVPYTRGREVSRPYEAVIAECKKLKDRGIKNITLLGQNVNSYGSDIVLKNQDKKPVFVKHLGKSRIPTLFPHLLAEVAGMGFVKVDFISSNPWDFSDELIDVIAKNANISRLIHLPVQSGDTAVLKRMNRWYTREEYLELVAKLKKKIPHIKLTTDIIVGFCGETDLEFANTVDLVRQVDFEKAYVAMYSKRPLTTATRTMEDDVPYAVKKQRWDILEELIYTSRHKKKV